MDEQTTLEHETNSPTPPVSTPQNKNDAEHTAHSAEQNNNRSEDVPNMDGTSAAQIAVFPKHKQRKPEHKLSVRQTARYFENNGFTFSERGIQKWCSPNSKGVCRLDCYYDEEWRKFFITEESIKNFIREAKEKPDGVQVGLKNSRAAQEQIYSAEVANSAEDVTNGSEQNKNHAAHVPHEHKTEEKNESEIESELKARNRKIEELEDENKRLKLDSKFSEYKVGRLEEEIKNIDSERKSVLGALVETQRQAGVLEGQLLQLGESVHQPKQIAGIVDDLRNSSRKQEQPSAERVPNEENRGEDEKFQKKPTVTYVMSDEEIQPEHQ